MPGNPAETMVGVGAVGFGVLLLYSAVKNKNPVDIVKHVVTTGNLDLSGIPGWDTTIASVARNVVKGAIIVEINQRVQNPTLRDDATKLLQDGTGDAQSIVQRMQDAGETDIASQMANYLNVSQPTGSAGGGKSNVR